MTFEELEQILNQIRSKRNLTEADYNRLIPKIERTRKILSECEIGEENNVLKFTPKKPTIVYYYDYDDIC